jgi:hypothetical protein
LIFQELLHQENSWLERAQQKLQSIKLGADAELLSRDLEVNLAQIIFTKNIS